MYMVKTNAIFASLFALLLIGLSSCDDVIAVNISDQTPVIIIPQANSTTGNPTHFKWEPMDGAVRYRLEIVTPSFGNMTDFVVDSVIVGTEIYISLDSNQYQFRLTAINAGYTSLPTSAVTFTVGTGQSSGQNSVYLTSPAANTSLSSTDVTFSWNSLPNVLSYTFELHKGTSFSGPLIQVADQLGSVSIAVNNLVPDTYTWGVKAYFNDGGETVFSKRTFTIDTLAPSAPTLITPASNAVINSGPTVFKWSVSPETGITSLIQIATDNQFSNIVHAEDGIDIDSVSYTIQTPHIYYWRVKNTDQSGNSATSAVSTFTLF